MDVIFRSAELSFLEELPDYARQIGSSFCPFVEPALSKGLLRFSHYRLAEQPMPELQKKIFYLGYLHTELLRMARASAASSVEKILMSENLIFSLDGEYAIDGKEMMDWPHWALKLLYTKTGVLFGKFWKGEKGISKHGNPIPPPPYHLLSIRSGIKSRDAQFFKKAEFLLEDFVSAADDGLPVLEERYIGESQHCVKMFCEMPSLRLVQKLLPILEKTGLYEHALCLGQNKT